MGLYDVGSVRVRGDMDLSDSFSWNEYLEKTGGTPAAWECFKQNRTPPENHFQVDSLLEAVDQRIALNETPPPPSSTSTVSGPAVASELADPSPSPTSASTPLRRRRFSVTGAGQQLRRFRSAPFSLARVIETAGPRLRVRLVGTDDRNDCWFLVDSDQIRPYPSHETLQPPFGYVHNHLVWNKTLRRTVEEGKAAPLECFAKPPPDPERNLFKKGDKLEAVDRHNAQLICPATIGDVSGLHVLVSFDGWSGNFDYWTRYDSRDLFPCGWCKLAGHALQSPGPAAIQHLELTPTKIPVPKPVRPHPSVPSTASRRKAPFRRRRFRLTGSTTRRIRATAAAARRSLDSVLTIKQETVSPLPTPPPPPPPPLPRLTVITKTLEDGSPQTMIKATPNTPSTSSEKSAPDTADGPLVASSESVEPPESFDVATVGGIGTECEGGERKRKKSKKHKRHNSKDGGHRHRISSFDLHRSVSLNDYYQPTKLVIRQRSGDLTGSSTAQLFVDTMEPPSPSPPPLLVPYQLPSNGFPTGDSPLADVLAQQKPAPTSVASISGQPFDSQSKMLSSSTASPASMDLGPCPLPNLAAWSVDDVCNYLLSKDSSLSEVANTFKQQEIDGSALLLLDIDTMRSLLKLKLGPALKVDDIVNRLKQGHR